MSRPVLEITNAALGFSGRPLWSDLNLSVAPGEFIAILGPNGSGKSSLLKAILGEQEIDRGSISLLGQPSRRGSRDVGYIPQQKLLDRSAPLRARDLVGLGVDGHRFGLPLPSRSRRARVSELLSKVGAAPFGNEPVALLSGGEQQRLRVGQALASEPPLLLCDEPLLSLDLHHQDVVSELIDQHRRTTGAAVLFVTHDINPVLGLVDRVLYLVDGKFRIGTPDAVLRTDILTDLYGSPVEVLRVQDRVVVVGAPETHHDAATGLRS